MMKSKLIKKIRLKVLKNKKNRKNKLNKMLNHKEVVQQENRKNQKKRKKRKNKKSIRSKSVELSHQKEVEVVKKIQTKDLDTKNRNEDSIHLRKIEDKEDIKSIIMKEEEID